MSGPIPTDREVRAQVRRICDSEGFPQDTTVPKLLVFLVETALAAPDSPISEDYVGIQFFRVRSENWDPKKDTRVRANTTKLRDSLEEYYASQGAIDPVLITLSRKRRKPEGYRPAFAYRRVGSRFPDIPQSIALIPPHALHTPSALDALDRFLTDVPNHPSALSMKAYGIAARAVRAQALVAPRASLEQARALIQTVHSEGYEPWPCLLADACVAAFLDWDWARAERLFDLAIRNSPDGNARYLLEYLWFLTSQGRASEAISILSHPLFFLSQGDIEAWCTFAMFQVADNRIEHAFRILEKVDNLAGTPRGHYLPDLWAMLEDACDRPSEALSVLMRGDPASRSRWLQAYLLGREGQTRKARRILRHLERQKSRDVPGYSFIHSWTLAAVFVALGEQDIAVKWLERAADDEKDPFMAMVPFWPVFRPLRAHSGFHNLILETMRLPIAEQLFSRGFP